MKKLALLSCAVFLLVGCFNDPADIDNGSIDRSGEFNTKSLGCGNFQVYKPDSSYSEYLVVVSNGDSLGIDTVMNEYDIAKTHGLSVYIDRYSNPNPECLSYCNDVMCENDSIIKVYRATSGIAEIIRTKKNKGATSDYFYINIKLKNVKLNGGEGEIFLKEVDFDSVFVGWLPG
jgi:hypothetical protein